MEQALNTKFRTIPVPIKNVEARFKTRNPELIKPRPSKKGVGVIAKAEPVIEEVESAPLNDFKLSLKQLKREGRNELRSEVVDTILKGLGVRDPDSSPLKSGKTVDEAISILDTNFRPMGTSGRN